MTKNIVIFSDGTGQRSGERFEENRTNVYKLYRATKCGPDSSVDPNEQFAFYDPGIGTVPPMYGFFGAVWATVWNLVCQATGLGLTRNIKDCYKAIVATYEPGDRIFLFGFSRGAYTVRCLATVLKYCGVPTRAPGGGPLIKSDGALECVATEAVERVYQHVAWGRESRVYSARFLEQRRLLADRFRQRWSSEEVHAHFIGVFDTVATVGNRVSQVIVAILALVAATFAAWAAAAVIGGPYFHWFLRLVCYGAVVGLLWFLATHLKIAFGLPGHPWWKTLHINPIRMQFYDKTLDSQVGWARHALAVDEHRADFDRVEWGDETTLREVRSGEPESLIQLWFAGNHADIGGGYPEPESRLSDAALAWMVGEATSIPDPLLVDRSVLRDYPSPAGMQHDETLSWKFRFAKKKIRSIDHDAPLDGVVLSRFELGAVLQSDERRPYRPENLRFHDRTKAYYQGSSSS